MTNYDNTLLLGEYSAFYSVDTSLTPAARKVFVLIDGSVLRPLLASVVIGESVMFPLYGPVDSDSDSG